MTGAAEQQRLAEAHWAEICRLSQAPRRRLGVRRRLGALLVRAGLRLVRPMTVPALLGVGEG